MDDLKEELQETADYVSGSTQELLQTMQELVEKSEAKMAVTQITTEPQVYPATYAATTVLTLAQAPITYAAVAQQYKGTETALAMQMIHCST